MAIYYLDIDDEITSAAARLRDSSDSRIALVLSAGSRVATSRINFLLLAREAKRRHKRLAIIAADPTVQSIARSAELPVYASVGEYEAAERAVASGTYGHSNQAVSQAFGDRWLVEARTAVLLVPSLVTQGREHNILLNPAHPDFARITHTPPEPVVWDDRLFPR